MKRFKNSYIIHACKQIDISLATFFFISIVCLINYECVIIKNPWHNNFAIGLNKIMIQIFYAYITGFIFYFVIELLPREKIKVAIMRLVCNNAFQINSRLTTLISEISKVSNKKVGDIVTYEEFVIYCHAIKIYSTPVKVYFYSTEILFKDFVASVCNEVKQNVEGLTSYTDMLDEN